MKKIFLNQAKGLSNKIKSIPFQVKAIEEMIDKTNSILQFGEKDRKVILSSTVGSGKTVMGAMYIDTVISAAPGEFAFVWLSPADGGLLEQSKESVANLTEHTRVIGLDDLLLDGELQADTAMFVNWERIKSKDNIARREQEGNNLDDVMNNTSEDLTVIVIIDETHIGADTELARGVMDIFDPDVTVGLSATPKVSPRDLLVEVPAVEVINSGRIKRGIKINEGFEEHEEDTNKTIKESLLDLAIEKQAELQSKYEEMGSDNIPLVLIQIGDEYQRTAKDEKREYKQIYNYLIEQGFSDDEIGIWLSESGASQNNVDILNNGIKFLIFKQAVSTGWNCPRAHVLVRFRASKSFVFDIQTAGRILRTIEGKHYGVDELDYAYVYTDDDEYQVKIDDKALDESLPIGKDFVKMKEAFVDIKDRIRLPMYKISNELSMYTPTQMLYEEIEKELGDINRFEAKEVRREYLKGDFDMESYLDYGGAVARGSYELTDEEINKAGEFAIRNLYSVFNVYYMVYEILMKHKDFENYENIDKDTFIHRLFLSNKPAMSAAVGRAVKTVEAYKNSLSVSMGGYEVKDEIYYRNVKDYASETFLYEQEVDLSADASSSERPFADFLSQYREYVDWWFKNGTGRDDFSIVYEDEEGLKREFYPDFIVGGKDGKLYILEVKAAHGDEDYPNVQEKYDAAQEYVKEHGGGDVVFTIMKLFEGRPTVCVGEDVENPEHYISLVELFEENN